MARVTVGCRVRVWESPSTGETGTEAWVRSFIKARTGCRVYGCSVWSVSERPLHLSSPTAYRSPSDPSPTSSYSFSSRVPGSLRTRMERTVPDPRRPPRARCGDTRHPKDGRKEKPRRKSRRERTRNSARPAQVGEGSRPTATHVLRVTVGCLPRSPGGWKQGSLVSFDPSRPESLSCGIFAGEGVNLPSSHV